MAAYAVDIHTEIFRMIARKNYTRYAELFGMRIVYYKTFCRRRLAGKYHPHVQCVD